MSNVHTVCLKLIYGQNDCRLLRRDNEVKEMSIARRRYADKKQRGENNDLEKKVLTFAPDLELKCTVLSELYSLCLL